MKTDKVAVENPDESIEEAQIRASFVSLVNEPFVETIDAEFASRFLSEEFLRALSDFVEEKSAHPQFLEGATHMLAYLQAEDREFEDLVDELSIDRTRLYKGISASYGPPPPIETIWVQTNERDNRMLVELVEEYASSGMAVSSDAHERPDYLGVELEYYKRLINREIAALKEADATELEIARDSQQCFLKRHLCHWVPSFIEQALPAARTDFFKGHLLMLKGFLEDERERVS